LAEWVIAATTQPESVDVGNLKTPESKKALVEGSWPELKLLYARFGEGATETPPIPRRAPHLEIVQIREAVASDAAVSGLPRFPGVKRLMLNEAMGLAAILGTPSRFPDVEKLELRGVHDWEGAWDALGSLAKLTELEIHDCETGSLAGLRKATGLRRLALGANQVDAAGAEALSLLPHLRELSLSPESIDRSALRRFGLPKSLEKLELGTMAPVSPDTAGSYLDVLKSLAALPRLRELKVDFHGAPEEMEAIAAIPGLEELTIVLDRKRRFDEAAMTPLRKTAGLRRLTLEIIEPPLPGVGIYSEDKFILTGRLGSAIRDLSRLERFDGVAAKPDFFAAIAGHPSLRRLKLSQATLADENVAALLTMPKLEHVHVSLTKVYPRAEARLSAHLQSHGGEFTSGIKANLADEAD
jgi:hypothetical protein